MFYGHIGVALASKPLVPKISLGLLLVAVTFPDILAGLFSLIGIEYTDADGISVIPWSHGLLMSIIWSLIVYGIAYGVSGSWRTGMALGLLVFSHWVLDFISHPMGMGESLPPDLPLLFNNSPKVGLGLYSTMAGAMITEFALLIAGSAIYIIKTRAQDRIGKWSLVALFLFLALMPLMMVLPERLIFLISFIILLLLPIGHWIERHRRIVKIRA
jgi:hypothetical protein